MNKEYKASNNSYREHFKLHGYLSPETITDLLDEYEALEREVTELEHLNDDLTNTAEHWQGRYAAVI